MWKKIMVRSGLLSVFLFFSFFISLFCSSSPSYATSDLVITIPANTTVTAGQIIASNFAVPGNSDFDDPDELVDFYPYHYLVITYHPTNNINVTIPAFYMYNNLTGNNQRVSISGVAMPYIISNLCTGSYCDPPYFELAQLSFAANTTIRYDLTFTFKESLCESCPEPDEPEPCPVIPENPYDDKFDAVVQAIYVCAGVMLVLYFFYCIYRLIIRNSGVK